MIYWWENSETANAAIDQIAKNITNEIQGSCANSINIAFSDTRVKTIIAFKMANFEVPFYMNCLSPRRPGETAVAIAFRKMSPISPITPETKLFGIIVYVDDKSSTVIEIIENASIPWPPK
ncbi:hypothetical protein [Nitrosospira multiformis]|uniref:hypothetical protein n=1 Tax=Nitrosospira multiformis TaxID=1231 RepID=UPI00089A4250|nr:hypothetical protein [Nitrosospira multiformis]SEA65882.1 hypothetical protein SAMN05216411_11745 [Nitrosospira multiformis]